MLILEGLSETTLFRLLSDRVLGNRKFFIDSKNSVKNWGKVSCLWDNGIWIGIVKFSLATTGYFSSAANVLTSCPQIWHVNKRNVSQVNWLELDQWIWKRCCDADFNSALARLQCCFSNGSLKRGFLDIYQTTFWESLISKLENLWGHDLLQNIENLCYISEIQQKIHKKFFVSEIISSQLVLLNCLY